jgi:hypothetical protein
VALTMQMNAVMTKAASEGNMEAIEQASRELDRIYAEQERVMEKWKRSETANTQ